MANTLLQHPHNYSFCIIYGLDVDTISKLNIDQVGISGFKMRSVKFRKLIKELPGLSRLMQEELSWLDYYSADEISYIFYSKDKKLLEKLYEFLILITASKIRPWVQFDAEFLSYNDNGKTVSEYQTPAITIFQPIGKLYDGLKISDILSIYRKDIAQLNKLLLHYFSHNHQSYYKTLLGLYNAAYHEEKSYFKFLMFFMLIESLVNDSDTTGVVYKIRRMCAVLIGEDSKMSEDIYAKISKAYGIRSKLVHSATNTLQDTNLRFIHSVVAELLLGLMVFSQQDGKVFDLSTRSGFGTKRSMISKQFKGFRVLENNRLNISPT